jgi:hypothetical protein
MSLLVFVSIMYVPKPVFVLYDTENVHLNMSHYLKLIVLMTPVTYCASNYHRVALNSFNTFTQ